MTSTLLYRGPVEAGQLDEVRAAAPDWEIATDPAKVDIATLRAAAGAMEDDLLRAARRLEWLHSWAAGPDQQLTKVCQTHPLTLTCSKGNGAIPLAEHAIMLMLMLNRGAPAWAAAQAARSWERRTHGELAGLTLGLLGLGNAGRDLARKAAAFHMRCIAMRRGNRPEEGIDRLYGRHELHEFLAASDVVAVTAPLTHETDGMLGEAEFRAMKPTALFLSISRGGIAQDDALIRALREGWIAGAGLDAHAIEPLPQDSPFWDLPNTIVTPHNGATTAATSRRGFEIFLENLRRFAAGEPLFNVVDKAAGY